MRTFFFILLTIIVSNSAFTQDDNLVPNPSFEELTFEAPDKQSIHPADFDVLINDWRATRISPDILTDKIKTAIPTYTNAKTGKVAVGLLNTSNCWNEYIRVELYEPLQKGKTYDVEFWYMIIKPQTKVFIDPNFGVFFNLGEEYPSNTYAKQKPQIVAYKANDTTSYTWHKVSGTFTPEENFSHLTIGQFQPDVYKRLYYYTAIDDILVRESQPTLKMEVGETIVLDNITFESATSTLKEEAYPALEKLYQSLLANKGIKLAINGHTDNVGSDHNNLTLSTHRAKAVYTYLLEKGIDKKRLTFQGFGEQQPIESNRNDSGRKKNRRVEFKPLEAITTQ